MKTGLGPISPVTALIGVLVGDRPELADDAEVVGRLAAAAPGRRRASSSRLHLAVGVGVQAEDRAEVHAGGVEQLQPVGLGAGHRLLVRVDAARAERLQADAGQEALAGVAPALDLEVLVVDVQRAGRVLHEHAVAAASRAGRAAARV